MVALPTDVRAAAKRPERLRDRLPLHGQRFGTQLDQNGRPRRATAQGIASVCIGGMVVARALVDPALANELRDACMSVALDLGGWGKPAKSKNGKFRRPQRR